MENNLPSISVVITTLNCEQYIGECLSRIISQDYPNELVEILVMDGGSTDKTREIVNGFPVRLVKEGCKYCQH